MGRKAINFVVGENMTVDTVNNGQGHVKVIVGVNVNGEDKKYTFGRKADASTFIQLATSGELEKAEEYAASEEVKSGVYKHAASLESIRIKADIEAAEKKRTEAEAALKAAEAALKELQPKLEAALKAEAEAAEKEAAEKAKREAAKKEAAEKAEAKKAEREAAKREKAEKALASMDIEAIRAYLARMEAAKK